MGQNRAGVLRQLVPQDETSRQHMRRSANADRGAAHPAMTNDLAQDEFGGARGDGETDALRAA